MLVQKKLKIQLQRLLRCLVIDGIEKNIITSNLVNVSFATFY